MTNEQTITDIINAIYDDIGFKGVIEFLENHFEYGGVERKENGLYMVYTSGWSEDKILIDINCFDEILQGERCMTGEEEGD